MKNIKKNQIVIYSIVLMLVIAGYLNYIENPKSLEISANTQNRTNIGDATLVSNNEATQDSGAEILGEENEDQIQSSGEELEEQQESQVANLNTTEITDEVEEYFTNAKLEREKMYSQMLETYQKILENASVSEEQKSIASNEITKINKARNAIMICENLIEIKGFEKSIILANGESVNVIVKAKELNTEEIAQIQNIINRELETTIENIHIMKK